MGHPRLQDRTEALVVAIDAAEVASLRDAHADIRDFASECVDEHEPLWEGGVAVKRWCQHGGSSLETGSDASPSFYRDATFPKGLMLVDAFGREVTDIDR